MDQSILIQSGDTDMVNEGKLTKICRTKVDRARWRVNIKVDGRKDLRTCKNKGMKGKLW